MNDSEELELLISERGVSPEGARCKELCTKSSATSGLGICPATGCPFKPTPLASTRSSSHLDMRQGVREPSQPPGNNDLGDAPALRRPFVSVLFLLFGRSLPPNIFDFPASQVTLTSPASSNSEGRILSPDRTVVRDSICGI